MSRKLGALALAMAILVCAMGVKAGLSGNQSTTVASLNGPAPMPDPPSRVFNGPAPMPDPPSR